MQESFYKDSIVLLEGAISEITARLETIRKYKDLKVLTEKDYIKNPKQMDIEVYEIISMKVISKNYIQKIF